MNILVFCISIIFFYVVSIFFRKKKYLNNFSGDEHQNFTTDKNSPLIGGLFILIISLILFHEYNIFFLIFLIIIFILGLFSDLKIISSPKKRFLLQIIIVFFFAYFLKLEISSTRIFIFDDYLKFEIFNIIFVCFCIMILVNGSNFIDGLNGLLLGYYLLVLAALLQSDSQILGFLKSDDLVYFSTFLLIFLIFNFFNLFFLGDNGAYLLGFIISFILIETYKENPQISPYYIILLLWYPCFELLFSIIRKFNLNYSPIRPDINHFHQLIYYLIKNKFNFNNLKSNNISSILILLYNMVPIFLGSQNIYNTQLQVILIISNILFYVVIYNLLIKYRNKIS